MSHRVRGLRSSLRKIVPFNGIAVLVLLVAAQAPKTAQSSAELIIADPVGVGPFKMIPASKGMGILAVRGGNPYANPPIPARMFALDVAATDSIRLADEVQLLPGHVGETTALEREDLFAVALIDGESSPSTTSSPKIGVPTISAQGSATWSKGKSIPFAGHIAIVQLNDGKLNILEYVTSPAPVRRGRFGKSVASGGQWLAVGEPGAGLGRVHIYSQDGAIVRLQAMIESPEAPNFGGAIAISGEYLFVGAPGGNGTGGKVFVYLMSTSHKPRLTATIENPIPVSDVTYGAVVMASGDFLVAGGHGLDLGDGTPFSGALDVYRLNTGTPKHLRRLDPGDVQHTDGFGRQDRILEFDESLVLVHRSNILKFGPNDFSLTKGRVNWPGKNSLSQTLMNDGRLVLTYAKRDGRKFAGWVIKIVRFD